MGVANKIDIIIDCPQFVITELHILQKSAI